MRIFTSASFLRGMGKLMGLWLRFSAARSNVVSNGAPNQDGNGLIVLLGELFEEQLVTGFNPHFDIFGFRAHMGDNGAQCPHSQRLN